MHDPRRRCRAVARNPIVHGLSKREKKKKQAKCREFVECLQSTTASHVRLHARLPPSYPVECDCPPNPAGRAMRIRIAQCAYRLAFAPAAGTLRVTARDGNRAPLRAATPLFLVRMQLARRLAREHHIAVRPPATQTSPDFLTYRRSCAGAPPCCTFDVHPRSSAFRHTMHPLTSALAKSRPQFDTRQQACAHPSVLPPPVAPPVVGAAPPPPAARVG